MASAVEMLMERKCNIGEGLQIKTFKGDVIQLGECVGGNSTF